MHQITRKLEFDAGHRVLNHGGQCRYLHGHHYVAEVTAEALGLDDLGMVIDFSKVKELVGGWINSNWDHNMILHPDDPLLDKVVLGGLIPRDLIGRDPFVMPARMPNPTAENMAMVLFNVADSFMRAAGLRVTKVRLHETPNCWADCDHTEERDGNQPTEA